MTPEGFLMLLLIIVGLSALALYLRASHCGVAATVGGTLSGAAISAVPSVPTILVTVVMTVVTVVTGTIERRQGGSLYYYSCAPVTSWSFFESLTTLVKAHILQSQSHTST